MEAEESERKNTKGYFAARGNRGRQTLITVLLCNSIAKDKEREIAASLS